MVETSARLLRLLSLFQGRRYWSGADLASRLEVTSRTLRRDVDKLRSLGYPIHSSSGAEGGYQMGAGSEMPPLLLDDEEAVAVALGLRSIAGVEEASLRALAKIEQILPQRLARRAAALQSMIVTAREGGGPPAPDGKLLLALANACRDSLTLEFGYQDRGGKASQRRVEPLRLVWTGYRWYLVAWDLAREDWRTFRVDRVQGKPRPGPAFTPRPAPAADLAAYVSKSLSLAPPCRARLRLELPAEMAAAKIPGWVGTVEPETQFTCFCTVGGPSYEVIANHLAMFGMDFHLVSPPPELVRAVDRVAARLLRSKG